MKLLEEYNVQDALLESAFAREFKRGRMAVAYPEFDRALPVVAFDFDG